MNRRRLSGKQRELLYEREAAKAEAAGRGGDPICNICQMPIRQGDAWDESHVPHKPRALGGTETGVGHRRCNRDHGAKVVTPLVAAIKRKRKKFLDIWRSSHPMPGGKDSDRYRKVDGTVVMRATGERA